MANDLNQCNFIGRLWRDPETRYTPSGDAVTNFSIAVGSSWTDKASGEKKEEVEWVRCVAWRKLGEICGEYLKKGSQVFVSGKMKTRKWDKEGVTHYTTEVVLDQMQMLGARGDREPSPSANSAPLGERPAASAAAPKQAAKTKEPAGRFDDMEDDIPF